MRIVRHLLVTLALLTPALAQVPAVTTSYTIPATRCYPSPEACTYHPDGIPNDGFGRFQTGAQWTKLVFDSYDAEYCDIGPFNDQPSQVWSVADTDIPPPPLTDPGFSDQSDVKLFTMDCATTTLSGGYSAQVGHNLHAELYAYSYLHTYVCGGRVRTTCHRTEWQTLADGSFVEDIIL